jgi:hypothetical protein
MWGEHLFCDWIQVQYRNVCPIVGIGSPIPSQASECVFPLGPKGGQHSLAGEGVRDPIRTTGRKPGILYTLLVFYELQYIFFIMANIRFYYFC